MPSPRRVAPAPPASGTALATIAPKRTRGARASVVHAAPRPPFHPPLLHEDNCAAVLWITPERYRRVVVELDVDRWPDGQLTMCRTDDFLDALSARGRARKSADAPAAAADDFAAERAERAARQAAGRR